MAGPYSIKFCYLLLHPYDPLHYKGAEIDVPFPRDAPYFYEVDMEYRSLKSDEKRIEGTAVQVQMQTIADEVWVAECHYQIDGNLTENMARQKQAINAALRQSLLDETGYRGPLVEEYTVVLIGDIPESPDEFVEANAKILAQLIRAPHRPLDAMQIQQVLLSQTRYSVDDLTIVDWEGAVVISKGGDFRTEIELLKIGNYQLLMYRTVDEAIDRQLESLRSLVGKPVSWFSNRRQMLRNVIESRLGLMLDFEKTDQSLLLIGDWYSSQLYSIIFDEFYMDEWKSTVSTKLENLSSIAEIIQQNLSLSWARLLDILQLIGWMVLLAGYFFILLRDVGVIH